jgi:PAS domain S-box-containing protein
MRSHPMSGTHRHVAERRKSSAAHVRAILDNTLDAVMAMDAEGVIRFWNPRAERTFGWGRHEAIGKSLVGLVVDAADRERLRQDLAGATAGGAPQRTEVIGRRRDGTSFPLEMTITVIPEDPDYRFSAFARDITERKRSEHERERLLDEAEHAREQSEAASRVKDEFLSTLSHELRTPLTAIVGWIYLLRGGRLDDPGRARALDAIDRNAGAQAQLISDILDLSRIVGAKFRLDVRPIQVAPVVAAAIETLMPAANARGIKVQAVLDPSAGLVSADTDRLRQVVWNLVSNAIKFTPRGGRVTARVERAGPDVVVTVEDSGAGISPQVLPYIFERFRQGDSSNTRTHGGLGLGLAVVRHLVELHGGQVTASSAGEGQGATFVVTIPLLDPAAGVSGDRGEGAPAAADELPEDAPRLDGVRVLVVDRSEDVREVVSRILRLSGAEVDAVGSAAEALTSLATSVPDVLVSAIDMEGETGYSLLRKVRSLPRDLGGAVPAAALTGFSRTEDRVRTLQAGFQMYMSKPVQPAELLAVVAALADISRRH